LISYNWTEEPDRAELHRLYTLLQEEPSSATAGLESLANRGSAMSMWYLADAYSRRAEIENADTAIYWYERAAKAGLVQAAHAVGRIYFEQNEYSKALVAFSVGVKAGYAPSLFRLGMMYQRGSGVSTDYEKCRALLADAAAKGHVFATRNIMSMYLSHKFGYGQFWRGLLMIPTFLRAVIALKFIQTEEELEEHILC
jgi:TPR repeat protein